MPIAASIRRRWHVLIQQKRCKLLHAVRAVATLRMHGRVIEEDAVVAGFKLFANHRPLVARQSGLFMQAGL